MKDDLISRQAAIDTLNFGAELLRRVLDDADVVGTERAKCKWGFGLIKSYISDIKDLSPAQPDITDAQAIEHLQATGWMQNHDHEMYMMGIREGLADDSDSYDSLIQPEQKTGEWIKEDRGGVEYTAVCSECGYATFWSDVEDFRYCPNCGKKMGENNETD